MQCVIKGNLESNWYCTWRVSGIQIFTIVVCLKFGTVLSCVIKVMTLVVLGYHWVMSTPRTQGVVTGDLESD